MSHANVKAEAIAQIQKEAVLSVWKISYERKDGRKWVHTESHYLSYEKAKAIYENCVACEQHRANLGGKASARNFAFDCVTVFTHE